MNFALNSLPHFKRKIKQKRHEIKGFTKFHMMHFRFSAKCAKNSHKTDTHWNEIGGYVGASALLLELGIEMPDILSDDITVTKTNDTAGDLAGMLNLTRQLQKTDCDYSVEGYDNHQMENVEWDFFTMFSYKAVNADPRTIYVIRDSFSTAMAPYIGSQFSEAYLRHKSTYSYEEMEALDPDIVVYEVVERYVSDFGGFSIQ